MAKEKGTIQQELFPKEDKTIPIVDFEIEEENIVKRTCKELGINQKELAEKLKVNDVTVRNWSSKGNVPETSMEFMKLLIENKKLQDKVTKVQTALQLLDEVRV